MKTEVKENIIFGFLESVSLKPPGADVCESLSVMSDSLRPRGLYSPWNSSG